MGQDGGGRRVEIESLAIRKDELDVTEEAFDGFVAVLLELVRDAAQVHGVLDHLLVLCFEGRKGGRKE